MPPANIRPEPSIRIELGSGLGRTEPLAIWDPILALPPRSDSRLVVDLKNTVKSKTPLLELKALAKLPPVIVRLAFPV